MKHIKLTAPEGMVLTNGKERGKIIYLGTEDNASNWQTQPEQEEVWND